MNTYYIYSPENWELLGQIQAVDADVAALLANHVWPKALKVLDFRLKLNRSLAA